MLRLSISQIGKYKQCPACWAFHYVDNIPEKPNISLIRGTAIHNSVAHFYRERIKNNMLTINNVEETYQKEIASLFERYELEEQIDQEEVLKGQLALRTYLSQTILHNVIAVEYPIEYSHSENIIISGFVDIITEDGDIIDIKTASRTPSGIESYIPQLTAYSIATKLEKCQLHFVIIKNKPEVIIQKFQINENNRRYLSSVIDQVAKAIEARVIYPNREHPFCSESFCSYWNICHEYYG